MSTAPLSAISWSECSFGKEEAVQEEGICVTVRYSTSQIFTCKHKVEQAQYGRRHQEERVAEALPLIPEQRQQRLLHLLRAHGVMSIRALTDELGVSHMTIRRDIAALE